MALRLLITGRTGQLAQALAERAALHPDMFDLFFLGRPEADFSAPGKLAGQVTALAPDLVINAAAFTAVDTAEDEPALAHRINAEAAGAIAAGAARANAPIVQMSTDYVFDGTKSGAYVETDPTSPAGAYGASKLMGERAVIAANSHHLIMRTAWVYAPFGHNFVRTMLRLAATRDQIDVVADQRGCPTSALDLADALVAAAQRVTQTGFADWGVYHLSGSGQTSWADFARRIFALSARAGGPVANVNAISTAQYPAKARRPQNSVLDCSKFTRVFGYTMPDWSAALPGVVARVLANAQDHGSA